MHNRVRKLFPIFLLPVTLAFSAASSAGSFTGYAVQVLNGCCGNPNFDVALVGMSTSATGSVQQYLATSDRSFAEMAVAAKTTKSKILVNTCSSGTGVCGMNF